MVSKETASSFLESSQIEGAITIPITYLPQEFMDRIMANARSNTPTIFSMTFGGVIASNGFSIISEMFYPTKLQFDFSALTVKITDE